jgi:hypothetical protein
VSCTVLHNNCVSQHEQRRAHGRAIFLVSRSWLLETQQAVKAKYLTWPLRVRRHFDRIANSVWMGYDHLLGLGGHPDWTLWTADARLEGAWDEDRQAVANAFLQNCSRVFG